MKSRNPPSPAIETSKTQKLYLVLRYRIVTGELEAGARLPSEPELCSLYGVSRVTVRRALDQLERDGLIARRPGAGTFVAHSAVRHPVVADLSNALAHLMDMGRSTGVRLLAFSYAPAPSTIAAALRLPDAEKTQRSVRVRLIDGEPFSYLVTHVPERLGATYSEQDLASTPLLVLLERSGARVERAVQTIGATLAAPEMAEALGIDVGAPLLTLTRVTYDRAGKGLEHLQAYYRPDRYTLQMELVRSGQAKERRWAPIDGWRARRGETKSKVEA